MTKAAIDSVKAKQAKKTNSFIKTRGGYYCPDGQFLAVPNGITRCILDFNYSGKWVVVKTRTSKTTCFNDSKYNHNYKESLRAAIEFNKEVRGTPTKKGFSLLTNACNIPDRKSILIEPGISYLRRIARKRTDYRFQISIGSNQKQLYVGTEKTYTEERFNQRLEEARKLKAEFLAQREALSVFQN